MCQLVRQCVSQLKLLPVHVTGSKAKHMIMGGGGGGGGEHPSGRGNMLITINIAPFFFLLTYCLAPIRTTLPSWSNELNHWILVRQPLNEIDIVLQI